MTYGDIKFAAEELPKEFAFLAIRKQQLKNELAQIEALESNILETRQLVSRNVMFIGVLSRDEFESHQTSEYEYRFLSGTLEFTPEELEKMNNENRSNPRS